MNTSAATQHTIWIVEDDEHIQELISYNLSQKGYRSACFEDAESALKKLREQQPDLILLDLMLPQMDGIDFCTSSKAMRS